MDSSDFANTVSLRIQKGEAVKEVALIVPYLTYIDNCVVPMGEQLFFLLDDVLCIFDIETLEIVSKTGIDAIGTMFAAYAYGEDFILYGEMDIYRIARDLSVKWRFSGRDIFVRCQSEEPVFEMKEDRICLFDFQDNYYEISYDGKLLNEGRNV